MPPENQPAGVAPAEARAFVQSFVPDPKVLEGMDDKTIVDYHGRVIQAVDKFRPKGTDKWPETWRQELAAGDEKAVKQLERYTTPAEVWKKARELEAKVTSGELRAVLGKDAPPEAVAAWRAQNGIPPTPDKYELKLTPGIKLDDSDKPILDAILGRLHAKNVSNEQASEFVNAYYDAVEVEGKQAAEQEAKDKQQVTDELNKKWGAEYRGNMNRISALLDKSLPANSKLKVTLQNTVAVNQEFAELMEKLAREINPHTTLIPGAGENFANALADEIKEIEDFMKKDRPAYNKDEAKQARYRALLEARDGAGAT